MFTVKLDKNLKREFCKSVSAIFKKVEVQFSAVISLVVNSESLVRVTRTYRSHVRFYVQFCVTHTIFMVSSESLVRVSRTCGSTYNDVVHGSDHLQSRYFRGPTACYIKWLHACVIGVCVPPRHLLISSGVTRNCPVIVGH